MAKTSMGCFLIGATGPGVCAEGHALIASVSDDPYDIRTFVRRVEHAGAHAHIGTELISTTKHSLVERGYFANPGETTRGINERGLAFTCAMVFETEAAKSKTVAAGFSELTRELMLQCATVDDALKVFEDAGTCSPAYSILLADANGDLAHLEAGGLGVNVHERYSREKPGMVFAVNCYLSSQLVEGNAPNSVLEDEQNNNLARRSRGQQLAQGLHSNLDVAAIARILSDHEHRERDPIDNPLLEAWGYSICNHGTRRQETFPHEELPWGTVSAEILQPSKKLLWYAYGWPCGEQPEYGDQIYQEKSWGKFVPFGFDESKDKGDDIAVLATVDGQITPEGLRSQASREPVSVAH